MLAELEGDCYNKKSQIKGREVYRAMIARIDKSGINLELEDDVVKYIDRKIGRLDRYLPRVARSSAHATATIRDTGNQSGNRYECEVILHIPGGNVTAKDSTMNQFAAIDIVEAKLRNQLHKYKAAHTGNDKARRGILRKVRERLFSASGEADI
jgi:ribosomal subunit interface protein